MLCATLNIGNDDMQWLKRTVRSFNRLTTLAIGDAILDSFFSGSSQRLCQEAPVPVVDVQHRSNVPGGAANCAVNLVALGAPTTLLSVVGSDFEGAMLRELLVEKGVCTDEVTPE
jgi:D-beta-D-heptose 7-phosphate kinase / D-beta-D-heptose 1-phosphate adenosyltransferase